MKNDINAQFWNFFDRVFCISVKGRTDRRHAAKKAFEKAGLGQRVAFHRVEKHPVNCEQGIFESHMACLKKGLEQDAETLLVFEDDVTFKTVDPRHLERSIEFMKNNQNWDIVFFGCLVRKSQPTENKSIRRIHYQSLAHGYAVNRAFAERLIGKKWAGVPYDAMLRECNARTYAVCPSFVFQSRATSDNDRLRNLERFRNLFGGLAVIQKANELYHLHWQKVVAAHILIVAAIALYVLW